MIRLLLITHGPLLYGAQQSLLTLMSRINRNRFTPILLSPRTGPLTEAAAALGIPIVIKNIEHWVTFGQTAERSYSGRLALVLGGLKGRVRAIVGVINEFNVDVVYTNTVTVIEGSLAARITRRPHVWHLREHIAGNRDLCALLPAPMISRIVGLLSKRVLVNSQALEQAYLCKTTANKLTVVHNGIDVSPYRRSLAARKALRDEFGIDAEAKIVAIVGRISPRKGHRLFIDAAARLRGIRGNTIFMVVGKGDTRLVNELTTKVRDLGLEDAFRFVGWRNDIARIMSAFDLLIVSAEQEAFGRTIIEAMAANLPVVATKCGGPEEIVIDGVTGFLIPLNDPDAMATKAAIILANDEFALRMGAAGHFRAIDTFSVDAYVKKIESVLFSVTA